MKDPYPQLLLSALALAGKADLIDHLSASATSGMVVDQLTDELNDQHAQPEDRPDPWEVHEVFSTEWPELCILVPMKDGSNTSCPIVNWLPALGPGEVSEAN